MKNKIELMKIYIDQSRVTPQLTDINSKHVAQDFSASTSKYSPHTHGFNLYVVLM